MCAAGERGCDALIVLTMESSGCVEAELGEQVQRGFRVPRSLVARQVDDTLIQKLKYVLETIRLCVGLVGNNLCQGITLGER